MNFILEKKEVLAYIVDHIGTESIGSLLLTMLDCEVNLETLGVNLRWSLELVPLFSQKIQNSISVCNDDLSGIGDFLDSLVRKYPNSIILTHFQSPVFVKVNF